MRNTRVVWIAQLVLACWLLAPGGAARAELRVVESTVPGISKNAVFPDGATFDVPAGRKVKFLKTPGNTTHEITGPYQGSLADYKPGCGWWDWARRRCGDRSGNVEGGTRDAAPVPGATRGFRQPQDEDVPGLSRDERKQLEGKP